MVWLAWYDKSKSKQNSFFFVFWIASAWIQHIDSWYTSLKASAWWVSFGPAIVYFISIPWRSWRRRQLLLRHKTNDASWLTQLLRKTSIWLYIPYPFAGLVVSFDVFALFSDGIRSLSIMLFRGKLECLLYINSSNRNVGQRYASPILIQNFTLFQPNDNFPSCMFLNLNRFPLFRRFLLFTNALCGCRWTFVFAVNRSFRSTVLKALGRFCSCVWSSTWSRGVPSCVTTNVGMLIVFSLSGLWSKGPSLFQLRFSMHRQKWAASL